ncbi:MAG: hypothetical protein PHZ26_00935 [Candidatus Gracilibacteria bacterium]|nr:hypothetical protein [Candidatus Gracilibacteria bacterium]MDD2908299.1 hypothetical protein [Candidatus Gracilibacteria bacterium]
MEKKEKNNIINIIIFNTIFILVVLYLVFSYVIPLNDENTEYINKTVETINKTTDLKSHGLNISELQTLVSVMSPKSSVSDLFKEPDMKKKISSVIKGTGSDYIAWLNDEISKDSEYKQILDSNNEILGQVLPIFYQGGDSNYGDGSNGQIKNRLTLSSFINFVENNILRNYNITSLSSIGIDKVDFSDNSIEGSSNTNNGNIGNFSLNIDFKGVNSDIYKMIDYIQSSGKIIIKNGKLENSIKQTEGINNILMSVKNINLSKPLLDNNELNQGAVEIIFYVRGVGLEQLLDIKKKLTASGSELFTKIESLSKLCDNQNSPICIDSVGLDVFTKLRATLNNAKLLKTKLEEKNKQSNIVNLDVNKELVDRNEMYSMYNVLENSYKTSNKFVENFGKNN